MIVNGNGRRKAKRRVSVKKNEQSLSTKRRRTNSCLIVENDVMKGTETVFEDYVIDRTESLHIDENLENEDSGVKPTSSWAERMQSSLLGEAKDLNENSKKKKFKKICFNCRGEHNISDCPRPKSAKRIQQNRLEITEDLRRRHSQYGRYTDKHIGKFTPGSISTTLREALGIGENEIPEYIYRMRHMGFVKGYPPGYLKKTMKFNGNQILKIFDSHESHNDHDDMEKPEIDKSKMICYQGFNGSVDGLIDRENFKVPPFHVFCEIYEKELIGSYMKDRRAKMKKQRKSKKKINLKNDADDDVIIIDDEVNDLKIEYKTPNEESSVQILEASKAENEPKVEKGESLFQSIGTPVLSRRDDSGEWKLSKLPSVDAFSVGIQPFEAKEECVKTGLFKKLMEKLKIGREEPEIEIIDEKLAKNR
ncbi:unnamed protein product [Caenorhabditis bovis]|uniref:PSP proline-rich domain-containing protein n=1 Tax=Caenorhabditis bovis TaxID=2654633 RepID=A0A8S1EHR6_9PELO|nr:unnamed protein product [Caenorhabditis bovis]